MATKKETKKKKVEQFKEGAKKAAQIAATPRTHLLPQTTWPSNENLDLRGDLAEKFEVEMVKAFEALQNAGSVFQAMIALNIQAGKVKINYIWNTGEIPTDKEVEEYKAAMEYMQKQREQFEKAQRGEVEDTVLETIGGQPLTAENLEAEKPSLIIQP